MPLHDSFLFFPRFWKAAGLTILLVEQNSKRALEIGDTAYLLVSGEVAFKGAAKELLEHRELGKLYLGLRPADIEK